MTTYSLYTTANRPPGSPSRLYSQTPDDLSSGPDDGLTEEERDAQEADFRGISLAEWKASKPAMVRTLASGLERFDKRTSDLEGQYGRQELEEDEDDVPLVNLLHKPSAPSSNPASLSTLTVKGSSGGIRWCRKCNAVKPDRCHHCSTCGVCVLMMGTSSSLSSRTPRVS